MRSGAGRPAPGRALVAIALAGSSAASRGTAITGMMLVFRANERA